VVTSGFPTAKAGRERFFEEGEMVDNPHCDLSCRYFDLLACSAWGSLYDHGSWVLGVGEPNPMWKQGWQWRRNGRDLWYYDE
jgi:hypothetical protein